MSDQLLLGSVKEYGHLLHADAESTMHQAEDVSEEDLAEKRAAKMYSGPHPRVEVNLVAADSGSDRPGTSWKMNMFQSYSASDKQYLKVNQFV